MTAHEQCRDDLPLYAVGALTPEESKQIERHLAECAECREELRGFHEAASHIAMAVPPSAPPAQLKTRLLARLEGEQPEPSAAAPASRKSSEHIPERRGLGAWFWLPAFATACLAILSVGLWVQDRALLRELRQQERITADLQFKQQAFENARAIIDTMTAVDAQHVTLAAAGAKREPGAKAVYSPQQHSLVLLAGNLNPLPANKVYELWLLPATGAQPVPAGTFQPDANGSATVLLSQFADGEAAKGFAVTIENEPGASAPTMPIVLSGTT